MTLNAKIGGFTDFFRDMRLHKSISFTRRRHRRQRHTRLWLMCIMVPMGRVQVICDFRNYNYWTGNAVGFRASRELCSNFLWYWIPQPRKVLHSTQYYPVPSNIRQYPIPQCWYRSNPSDWVSLAHVEMVWQIGRRNVQGGPKKNGTLLLSISLRIVDQF